MDGLLFRRDLDAFDLVELFDPALHLLGLGGLVAEAVDEGFEMVDAILLVAVSGFELGAAVGFLREIFVVIAGVEIGAAIPDFEDAVHGDVEEIAVVGDQDKGVWIVLQILFEPVARFEVEVVGGLIEQQQIGLGQQELGETDAHLPAAGKLAGGAVHILARKAQAVEHRAGLRFQRIAVAALELGLHAVVAVGDLFVLGALRVDHRHLMRDRLHLLFHIPQTLENGETFFQHAAPGEREAVLGKVAGGDSLADRKGAFVETFDSREDLEQGRFARAVPAHEADALRGADDPVQPFEKGLGAEVLSGGRELNHSCVLKCSMSAARRTPARAHFLTITGRSSDRGHAEALTACGKSAVGCHSERSEESLLL